MDTNAHMTALLAKCWTVARACGGSSVISCKPEVPGVEVEKPGPVNLAPMRYPESLLL